LFLLGSTAGLFENGMVVFQQKLMFSHRQLDTEKETMSFV
jgi:hypothetical protein